MQEALLITSLANLDSLGSVEIRLKGSCMWPIVRDGDQVRIEKFDYARLTPGDVMIFQTTSSTLHTNTLFRKIKKSESTPEGYIGKVSAVTRGGKTFALDRRGPLKRAWQILCSPANPYFLGLPASLLRKGPGRPMSV